MNKEDECCPLYIDGHCPEHGSKRGATKVEKLIRRGYKQTSSKYRTVACLPEGMTGLQALESYNPDAYKALMERTEQQAADTFRRVNATGLLQLELTEEEFTEFKKKGGEVSW